MYKVRKSIDRGAANFGWLDSKHTFSFGQFHDPRFMGFRSLRVINEDRVTPGAGFPEHGHANMEIISYVLNGGLEHRDSLGNGSIIRPGDVQRMSAGTGITHSEFNASKEDPVHFLQIWLLPASNNIAPGYEQKDFGDERRDALRLTVSSDGRDGSLSINQDADIYASILSDGKTVSHELKTWPCRLASVGHG